MSNRGVGGQGRGGGGGGDTKQLVVVGKAGEVINAQVGGSARAYAGDGSKGFGARARVAVPSKSYGGGGAIVTRCRVAKLVEGSMMHVGVVPVVDIGGNPNACRGKREVLVSAIDFAAIAVDVNFVGREIEAGIGKLKACLESRRCAMI